MDTLVTQYVKLLSPGGLLKTGKDHARERFEERSALPAEHFKALRTAVSRVNKGSLDHLPHTFAIPFKDRSKAVLEKVDTRGGPRLVIKTVLSPTMHHRGTLQALAALERPGS